MFLVISRGIPQDGKILAIFCNLLGLKIFSKPLPIHNGGGGGILQDGKKLQEILPFFTTAAPICKIGGMRVRIYMVRSCITIVVLSAAAVMAALINAVHTTVPIEIILICATLHATMASSFSALLIYRLVLSKPCLLHTNII